MEREAGNSDNIFLKLLCKLDNAQVSGFKRSLVLTAVLVRGYLCVIVCIVSCE